MVINLYGIFNFYYYLKIQNNFLITFLNLKKYSIETIELFSEHIFYLFKVKN